MSPDATPSANRIKAGWPNPQRNTFKTPFELAARELRESRRIELEYAPFLGVGAELAALREGSIDVGFMTLPQIVEYSRRGMELRIVLGFLQRHTFRLVAARRVSRVDELRGATVSIQPGTGIAGLAMHLTLQSAGLQLERDVQTCNIIPIPEIVQAMAEEKIAGCPLGVDTALKLQRDWPGRFHILGAGALESPAPMLVVAWVTTESILTERRAKLQRLVEHLGSAYDRAYDLGATELAGVAKAMEFLTDYHLDDLEASLRTYLGTRVWPAHGQVTQAHWTTAMEVYRKAGVLEGSIAFEQVRCDLLPG